MRDTLRAIIPARAPKRTATGEGVPSSYPGVTSILTYRLRQASPGVAVTVCPRQAAPGCPRASVAADGEEVILERSLAAPSRPGSPSNTFSRERRPKLAFIWRRRPGPFYNPSLSNVTIDFPVGTHTSCAASMGHDHTLPFSDLT